MKKVLVLALAGLLLAGCGKDSGAVRGTGGESVDFTIREKSTKAMELNRTSNASSWTPETDYFHTEVLGFIPLSDDTSQLTVGLCYPYHEMPWDYQCLNSYRLEMKVGDSHYTTNDINAWYYGDFLSEDSEQFGKIFKFKVEGDVTLDDIELVLVCGSASENTYKELKTFAGLKVVETITPGLEGQLITLDNNIYVLSTPQAAVWQVDGTEEFKLQVDVFMTSPNMVLPNQTFGEVMHNNGTMEFKTRDGVPYNEFINFDKYSVSYSSGLDRMTISATGTFSSNGREHISNHFDEDNGLILEYHPQSGDVVEYVIHP